MDNEIRLSVALPTDDEGMVGRECPNCQRYFKLKPGTGLTDISTCTCPYCERPSESGEFLTEQQKEYVKSVAVRQVLGPLMRKLENSFKDLERSTRNSLVSFKVHTSGFNFPVKYYTERDLETTITCDNCGLVFSIFGIFATCPDCARLSAMSMFRKSLEVTRKALGVLSKIPEQEAEIRQALIVDTLAAAVSTFDSLGKRLQKEYPALLPDRPKNLFQNLDHLTDVLRKDKCKDLAALVGGESHSKIHYLFQVRHIWSHNFGEADADFIRKTGVSSDLLRTKIVPLESEIEELLSLLETLGVNLRRELQERTDAR